MPVAANDSYYSDKNCLDEALGQQWGRARQDGTRRPVMIADRSPGNPRPYYVEHNGGLVFRHRAEFYEGDLMVRFTGRGSAGLPDDVVLNSPWWLNDARFVELMNRAREAGVGLVEMARRQLAIPEDWSTCEQLIVAQPKVLLAAYAGPGRTANAGTERRIVATAAPGLWIDQLYIPGLGRMNWLAPSVPRPNNGSGWLTLLRKRPTAEVERGYRL